jgi:hypothetical protein
MDNNYTIDDIFEYLSVGREIEFEFEKVLCTICNEQEGWILHAGELGKSKHYSTYEELLNSYKLKNTTLIDIFKENKAEITTIF